MKSHTVEKQMEILKLLKLLSNVWTNLAATRYLIKTAEKNSFLAAVLLALFMLASASWDVASEIVEGINLPQAKSL